MYKSLTHRHIFKALCSYSLKLKMEYTVQVHVYK